MAFKRAGSDTPPEGPKAPDVKLVDELVRKSLAINPGLRQGRDTGQVLKGLQNEARSRSKTSDFGPGPAATTSRDPRLQTIDIFMREKSQTFPQAVGSLVEQVQQVYAQIERVREETIREISELVGALMLSGADTAGVQATLRGYRDLLESLKVSELDIMDRAKKRR